MSQIFKVAMLVVPLVVRYFSMGQETELRVRVSFDLKDRLKSVSQEMEMSISDYVRWILKESVKED